MGASFASMPMLRAGKPDFPNLSFFARKVSLYRGKKFQVMGKKVSLYGSKITRYGSTHNNHPQAPTKPHCVQ